MHTVYAKQKCICYSPLTGFGVAGWCWLGFRALCVLQDATKTENETIHKV